MYYDVKESGVRIKNLREVHGMTRLQLSEKMGISSDALKKIEVGKNGAKIDTLISLSELFHVTLDYLVCGREEQPKVNMFAGLNKQEVMFVKKVIADIIQNMELIR